MDFIPQIYKSLLIVLKTKYSNFLPLSEYLNNITENNKIIVLRHDVDRLPQNSLLFAKLENELGIRGTYYFRIVPESYDLEIMNKIAELGHEIGYHYEDVDLVIKNFKLDIKNDKELEDLIDLAFESFCNNLEMFRKHFNVKTVCMHGSPRAKYDNKLIWKKYNYKDLGIIGEPYYDIDFNEFAYFTDTGRRWNGDKVSIRDKVQSKYNFDFRNTIEIINNINRLPERLMFTIHPERWHENKILWVKEAIWQNIKNIVKRIIVLKKKN